MRTQRLRPVTHREPAKKKNSGRKQRLSTRLCKIPPPHGVISVVEAPNNALVTIRRATRKCYNPRVILRFAYGHDNAIAARADQDTCPESQKTMLTRMKNETKRGKKQADRERPAITDYWPGSQREKHYNPRWKWGSRGSDPGRPESPGTKKNEQKTFKK